MILMGGHVPHRVLPTYEMIGVRAPALLVLLRLIQGFAVAGEISGATHDRRTLPVRPARLLRSFTLQGTQAGQILAAAVFLPLAASSRRDFQTWGWRIPFLLSALVVVAGYIVRRRVDETPAFQEESAHGEVPKAPIVQAVRDSWPSMLRVMCMALMNIIPVTTATFGAALATNKDYGVGMSRATYLWISVLANVVAVFVIPPIGNWSDKIGRRPLIIGGALGAGLMSFVYLYFVMQGNVPATMISAVIMWGLVYQGYNAVFPSYYQELFPTKTRVTGFAVSQNIGTAITAFLPSIFALIAPPGASNIPLTIGAITFGITVIAAIAAFTGPETNRVHLNDLGSRDAAKVPQEEFDRIRAAAV